MSLLASSRATFLSTGTCLLPQELYVSCFHTSSVHHALRRDAAVRTAPTSAAPSRRRLVKDLTPRSTSKSDTGKLIVATREPAPHTEAAYDRRKERENDLKFREAFRKRRELRLERDSNSRKGSWSQGTSFGTSTSWSQRKKRLGERRKSSSDPDLPDFDQPWRTSKDVLDRQRRQTSSYSDPAASTSTTPRKPQVSNPLSDEFDISARAVSTRQLPTEFSSPPLMEGLLTSVKSLLGPDARPTPIQALSLKHIVSRLPQGDSATEPPSNNSDKSSKQLQYLLASETGSGKSIAYLMPVLQDLKLSELRGDEQLASRLPLSPRAIVLAPTHELSRQLSGFAKALLHEIKLRVMCVSQANLPSTSKRNVTASKMAKELDELMDGENPTATSKRGARPVDIVVGTPSRILELIKGRGWNHEQPKVEDEWDVDERGKKIGPRRFTVGKPEMGLERVQWIVVDEADVLFDPDFQEDTQQILSAISEACGVKTEASALTASADPSNPAPIHYPFHFILSTATIPSALAWYLDTYHPSLTRLASPNLHHLPSTLKTEYVAWTGGNRNADVEHRLRRIWQEDVTSGNRNGHPSKVLIFCNKSTKVEDLGRYLTEKGIANVALTSTSEARKRGSNHHLDGFLKDSSQSHDKEAKSSSDEAQSVEKYPHVMITTSLLSRGLDFSAEIRHVFIVDEPRNMVDFLHRAGRSGRAGEQGKVVVFGKAKGRGAEKTRDMRKKIGALVA